MPDSCQTPKPTLLTAEPVQICLTGVWPRCILLCLNVCVWVSTSTVAYVSFTELFFCLFFFFDRFKFGKVLQPLCCISLDTDVDIYWLLLTFTSAETVELRLTEIYVAVRAQTAFVLASVRRYSCSSVQARVEYRRASLCCLVCGRDAAARLVKDSQQTNPQVKFLHTVKDRLIFVNLCCCPPKKKKKCNLGGNRHVEHDWLVVDWWLTGFASI